MDRINEPFEGMGLGNNAIAAADIIRRKAEEHGFSPEEFSDFVILGSGLGNFPDAHMDAQKIGNASGPIAIPFQEIYDELDIPSLQGQVAGHARRLVIGPLSGEASDKLVIAQAGREHPYEDVSLRRATFWVRVMQVLGLQILMASNAAGIVTARTLAPGDLMLVHSSRDLGPKSPLIGPHDARLGERFPHKGDLYPAGTRELIKAQAKTLGINLKEGTLVRSPGPEYEAPEDVYAIRAIVDGIWRRGRQQPGETRFGWDPTAVVGMSTTYEMLAAQDAATRVGNSTRKLAFQGGRAVISAATNYAAGLGPKGLVPPPNHEEVQASGRDVEERFGNLVRVSLLALRQQITAA